MFNLTFIRSAAPSRERGHIPIRYSTIARVQRRYWPRGCQLIGKRNWVHEILFSFFIFACRGSQARPIGITRIDVSNRLLVPPTTIISRLSAPSSSTSSERDIHARLAYSRARARARVDIISEHSMPTWHIIRP